MPAWGPEPGGASDSGDLGCGEGEGEEENHLRLGGMGTGAVSDGGSLGLSIRVSSSFGGVGGMMFVTGGCSCGVSRIGAGISVRAAASIGGDGSSPSPDRSLLGRLGDDDDEANQARFFGTNLTSGSDRPALTDEGSEFGKLAGAPSDSGCSSGGGHGIAATFTVGWEAGWALAGCSLGGSGGACSASSFRGTLDEPRRDNDANHERGRGSAGGVGVDIGPGVSGVAFVSMSVGSGSEAGESPALFVGEGEEDGCGRSGCGSSGIRKSQLRDWMANTAKTCRTE
jgi:hypothetical protein